MVKLIARCRANDSSLPGLQGIPVGTDDDAREAQGAGGLIGEEEDAADRDRDLVERPHLATTALYCTGDSALLYRLQRFTVPNLITCDKPPTWWLGGSSAAIRRTYGQTLDDEHQGAGGLIGEEEDPADRDRDLVERPHLVGGST